MISRLAALVSVVLLMGSTAAAAQVPAAGSASPDWPASSSVPAKPDLSTAEGQAQFMASLTRRTGAISLPEAKATLDLGKRYYFLDAADSRKVIIEAWGNPAEAADGVLGMVFAADQSPLGEADWGAVVSYMDSGYVSDKDARKTDYAKVLGQLRDGEDKDNEQRRKTGFPQVHLVGWAQPPSYDQSSHALIWARQLHFGEQKDDGLNYDVRVLGRRGVLNLNMVSRMSELPQLRSAAVDLQRTVRFDAGSQYADYKPGVDKRAAFGLAGLVLAGAGLAVAQKAGLIAVALLFLKKGLVVIIAAGVAAWAWLRRRFGGDKMV